MKFSMSLYSSFFQITKQKHDQIFLTDGDRNFTYHEVLEKSLKIAGYLLDAGVQKRSRVAVMLPSSPDFFFIVLALSRLECAVVPVDPHFKALALRHVLSDADIPVIIYHKEYENSVTDAIDILDNLKVIVAVGGEGSLSGTYIDDSLNHALYGGPFHPDSRQEAVIFFSSGTSGPSKGGIFNNRQLLMNARSFNESMILHENEALCAQFPLHHFWGFTTVLVSSLIKGNRVFLINEPVLPETPESSRGMILIADPDFYDSLHKAVEKLPDKYLYGMTAGGHLKPEVQSWFYEKFHFPIFRGYGLIEAGPVILINNDETKLRSVGVPLNSVSVSIREGESVVPDQKIGELCIRKESVVTGFTSAMSHIEESFTDGWYHSGDLCTQDLDGYIYFVDRIENRIRVNGFDMFPESAENILKKHGNVKEAVIVGVPVDNRGNEKVVAYVVPEKMSQADAETLKYYLRGKIPIYQIPSDFVFVNHLPVGATAKISRQTIRRNAIHHNTKNNNLSSKPEDDV